MTLQIIIIFIDYEPYHIEVEIYKSCDHGIDHVSSLYI